LPQSGTADLLDLANQLFEGRASIEEHHPVGYLGELAEVADGVAFVPSLANVSAFATGDGLVLIDSGGFITADRVREQLRGWSDLPVHTVVYTHGHVDHVFGVPAFEAEAAENGWPAPRVIAHRNVPARFERYELTAGYNGAINARQFQLEELRFPTDFRAPDETYDERASFEVGGESFELRHARGETDDHTWVWVPGRRILCCGDLFIWATPNAGNPQKAQRYPREWAAALREMADLGAELMLPGHGLPVAGADRVHAALTDTAALLESLVDQTLELMNEGAPLDRLLQEVEPPPELIAKPYLRPVYDEPEFIVRNLWRLYGGWYDGDPSRLKPAPAAELANELADLAGGPERLAGRATELAADGKLRLAGHLAELATLSAPQSDEAHEAREQVNARRAGAASSTMARGIFSWAAAESRRALERQRSGKAPR
jgi:glyoxylase-like metal-dependent hydrolase (beta-lactamase superfamily II)